MKIFQTTLSLMNLMLGMIYLTCMYYMQIDFSQKAWSIQISLALLALIFSKKKNLLSPNSLFALSVLVFIWSRLLLNVFFDLPIVQAGNKISEMNIFKTSLLTGISISLMILSSFFSERYLFKKTKKFFIIQKSAIPKRASKILLFLGFLFSLFFLIDSLRKIDIIQSSNYLEVAGTTLLTSGIIFFLLAKLAVTIWIFLGRENYRFYVGSLILFVGSIGFYMIGLRGYGICYFLLFLFFYNIKKELNIYKLTFLALGVLVFSNFILEYRLGFSISKGILEVIINTFHSQGASFESVFGAVVFKKELLGQMNIIDYFSGAGFGLNLGFVRGVNFEFGGFATSFFAEAYYLGMPVFLILSVCIGTIVGILENLFNGLRSIENNKFLSYPQMILFLTIPNLVYFSRATAFDLIDKFIKIILVLILLICVIGKRYNRK